MIRAAFIDGHWRVVDDFDQRYLPDNTDVDGAVDGSFVSCNSATEHGWTESTRFDERSALLLAGVLRRLHDANQERAMRILSTCEPCRARFRNKQ
jgi:hypothetical protein